MRLLILPHFSTYTSPSFPCFGYISHFLCILSLIFSFCYLGNFILLLSLRLCFNWFLIFFFLLFYHFETEFWKSAYPSHIHIHYHLLPICLEYLRFRHSSPSLTICYLPSSEDTLQILVHKLSLYLLKTLRFVDNFSPLGRFLHFS